MSADLYFTVLQFGNGSGLAKLHGQCRALTAPPQFLPGHQVHEVYYVPEVHCWRIRADFEGWRDMRPDEATAAGQFLVQAHAAP